MAILLIERVLAIAALAGIRAQVTPPSRERKRPTPASESAEALGSPVPA
jgi:hypothetical protein